MNIISLLYLFYTKIKYTNYPNNIKMAISELHKNITIKFNESYIEKENFWVEKNIFLLLQQ